MIIDGKKVSLEIKNKLLNEIKLFDTKPSLVVLQIGENDASDIYIKQKKKIAEEIGINFIHTKFNEYEDPIIIKEKIKKYNEDDKINGIILQLPIPNKFDKNKLINLISPLKDVDGLTNESKINLINNNISFVPCTPLGIIELFKYYKIELSGSNVVIVGRSELVGKPLFNLLLNMDATVTLCHSKTKNLINYTKNADILISAVGIPHLIKNDMIKTNSIIIDVGINRENGKIIGDTDYEELKDIAKYITPVPGGVGPMTVIMLMQNVIMSYKKSHSL